MEFGHSIDKLAIEGIAMRQQRQRKYGYTIKDRIRRQRLQNKRFKKNVKDTLKYIKFLEGGHINRIYRLMIADEVAYNKTAYSGVYDKLHNLKIIDVLKIKVPRYTNPYHLAIIPEMSDEDLYVAIYNICYPDYESYKRKEAIKEERKLRKLERKQNNPESSMFEHVKQKRLRRFERELYEEFDNKKIGKDKTSKLKSLPFEVPNNRPLSKETQEQWDRDTRLIKFVNSEPRRKQREGKNKELEDLKTERKVMYTNKNKFKNIEEVKRPYKCTMNTYYLGLMSLKGLKDHLKQCNKKMLDHPDKDPPPNTNK